MPETFTRPNGKTYRPRKLGLIAEAWEDQDYNGGGASGVIVLGTLDPDAARPIALDAIRRFFDVFDAAAGEPGWFRNGFHSGERRWFIDCEKGRPGVSFTAVDA